MLSLLALSTTIYGLTIAIVSNIDSLVSFVAVAVRAMKGTLLKSDLNSCSCENHTLNAACLLLFDLPLK